MGNSFIQKIGNFIDAIVLSRYWSTFFKVWLFILIISMSVFFIEDIPQVFSSPEGGTIAWVAFFFILILVYIGYNIKKFFKKLGNYNTEKKDFLPQLVQLILLLPLMVGIGNLLDWNALINAKDGFIAFHKAVSPILIPYSESIPLKHLFIVLLYSAYDLIIVYLVTFEKIRRDLLDQISSIIQRRVNYDIVASSIQKEMNDNSVLNVEFKLILEKPVKILGIESTSSKIEVSNIQPDVFPINAVKNQEVDLEITLKPIKTGKAKFSFRIFCFINTLEYKTLKIFYALPKFFNSTEEYQIDIFPPEPKIEVKYQYESEAKVEEHHTVRFEIANKGEGIAKNIEFSFELPEKTRFVEKFKSIKSLPANSDIITRHITVEALYEGFYEIPFSGSYMDQANYSYAIINENQIVEFESIKWVRKQPDITVKTIFEESVTSKSSFFRDVEEKLRDEFKKNSIKHSHFFKTEYEQILTQILNYKNKVHNTYWRITSKIKKEREFLEDISNYLAEEDRFPDKVLKEVEIGAGRIDILIQDVPMELKLIKKESELQEIILDSLPQLQQYCSDTNQAFGFLLALSVEPQDEKPLERKAKDVNLHAMDSGKHPINIIEVLIRGGKRTSPSKLKAGRSNE